MVMTSDMWLAPRIPAMKEIAEFDQRYAQKLVRPDDRRRLGRTDGGRDGDVPEADAGAGEMRAEGGEASTARRF